MSSNGMTGLLSKARTKLRASHLLFAGIAIVVILAGVRLSERLVLPDVVPPPPLAVEALRITPRSFVITARYSGSVVAQNRATLSARLASTVKARYVKEGDTVKQGQLLVRLDDAEQQQELLRLNSSADRIRADLNYWQAQYKVEKRLNKSGSISERKLQETLRRVTTLKASLEENRHARASSELRLGYTEVVAPFAGIVQSVLITEGESVNPGTPLLEVVDMTALKAVFRAPQSDSKRLFRGLQVYLDLHRQAAAWQGEIRRIYPALDSRSRNLTFEVPLPHEEQAQVQAGMSVGAVVELERLNSVISVPLHSVQKRQGREGVFAVRDGRAAWLPVKTGIIQGDLVQLTEGVSVGEVVITTPHPALESGRTVQVYRDGEQVRTTRLGYSQSGG